MDLTLWISFTGTVLILTVTPGPSILLVTANSMKFGRTKTIATILGDLTANLFQMFLASAGLATIVVSSAHIFQTIKWLGVAYLVYIGINKMVSNSKITVDRKESSERSFLKLYSEGFLMSAANPKAIVFFAALFPLFIDASQPFAKQVIVLAATFIILDGLSLMIYSFFANRLKNFLENQNKVNLQNKIVGALLILSGFLLSTINRSD